MRAEPARPSTSTAGDHNTDHAEEMVRMECGLDALLQPSPSPKFSLAPPYSVPILKSRDLDQTAAPTDTTELKALLGSQQDELDRQHDALSELSEDMRILSERVDVMQFKQDLILQTMPAEAGGQKQVEERPSATQTTSSATSEETSGIALEFSAALGVEVGALRHCMENQRKQQEEVVQTLQSQVRRLEQQFCNRQAPQRSVSASAEEQLPRLPQTEVVIQTLQSQMEKLEQHVCNHLYPASGILSQDDVERLQMPVDGSRADMKQVPAPLDILQRELRASMRGGSPGGLDTDFLAISQPVQRDLLQPGSKADILATSQPVPTLCPLSSSTLSSTSPRLAGSHGGPPARDGRRPSPVAAAYRQTPYRPLGVGGASPSARRDALSGSPRSLADARAPLPVTRCDSAPFQSWPRAAGASKSPSRVPGPGRQPRREARREV